MPADEDELKRLHSNPVIGKQLDNLRDVLTALATIKALHDKTKLYTKEEALLLYLAELRDRGGDELLFIFQRLDPMWDGYDWDEESELFTPVAG